MLRSKYPRNDPSIPTPKHLANLTYALRAHDLAIRTASVKYIRRLIELEGNATVAVQLQVFILLAKMLVTTLKGVAAEGSNTLSILGLTCRHVAASMFANEDFVKEAAWFSVHEAEAAIRNRHIVATPAPNMPDFWDADSGESLMCVSPLVDQTQFLMLAGSSSAERHELCMALRKYAERLVELEGGGTVAAQVVVLNMLTGLATITVKAVATNRSLMMLTLGVVLPDVRRKADELETHGQPPMQAALDEHLDGLIPDLCVNKVATAA